MLKCLHDDHVKYVLVELHPGICYMCSKHDHQSSLDLGITSHSLQGCTTLREKCKKMLAICLVYRWICILVG
ncbi:hypothetical protein VIGAN_03263500 [Vigna angularis var. angularis]|uniref:Uncharacterized protein n=1 Tax=Vigna angularis var. angularis TaxID=157739 RepID=A0A0S3RPV4_PHAAN|nr:hypothetical protein VIGAN_03263500 [Vigna angularis var. angularis]